MELLVPSLRWVSLFSVSNNIRSRWNLTAFFLFLWTGCVHWGRYVFPTREKGARHTRRFRNGSSKGNEERNGEHVAEEVVEVYVYIIQGNWITFGFWWTYQLCRSLIYKIACFHFSKYHYFFLLAFYSHFVVGSDDKFREQGRVDEVTMNLKMTRPCPTQFSILISTILWDANIQFNAHEQVHSTNG